MIVGLLLLVVFTGLPVGALGDRRRVRVLAMPYAALVMTFPLGDTVASSDARSSTTTPPRQRHAPV